MEHCAYITTLNNLHRHPNADRLMIGECFGNQVIVDNKYTEGQIGIYFPSDMRIGKEFAEANNLLRIKNEDGTYSGGYLDPEKRNIKAMRLRGEKSDGLFLPLSSLDKFYNINELKLGEQITMLNKLVICEKYIPHTNSITSDSLNTNKNGKKRKIHNPIPHISFPFFEKHVDTAQLRYNWDAFKPNDLIYLTIKAHGSSHRISNAISIMDKPQGVFRKLLHIPTKSEKAWKIVNGSRRVVIGDNDGGFYGSNEFRMDISRRYADRIPKGVEVFGEIVGYVNDTTPIMPDGDNRKLKDPNFVKLYGNTTKFTYGCNPGEHEFYVYRMTFTNEDGFTVEIPWENVKHLCDVWGMKHVVEVDKFLFTTKADMQSRIAPYLDVPDPIGKTHVTEGVVVRIDNRPSFTAYKEKSFNFKVLEGIIKDESGVPDMEEAQDAE